MWKDLEDIASFGNDGVIILINPRKLWLPARVQYKLKSSTFQHEGAPGSQTSPRSCEQLVASLGKRARFL